METSYLAHISEDGREETVQEHLQETAKLASEFAAGFAAEEQGFLAGIAHDIGKYSGAFQKRIHGASIRVDHSAAGAWECAKLNQYMAAIAVAGHHGGLPDWGGQTDNVDAPTMCGKLNRAKQGKLENYDAWSQEIRLPNAKLPEFLRKQPNALDMNFFTRMLYSCLVDADFLSTEEFMSGHRRSDSSCQMKELEDRLKNHTAKWFPPRGELNTLRCQILQRCYERGEKENPGLYTLTVPTGGGKTVSSLAFALAHARANQMERIVYVIPYTSIIEQNARVFRDILGEEAVLEHHSGVLYDLEKEADPTTIRMAQATENWDKPVVVTTAVQFFESLFASRSSKCRKLHNLARSVIIFDEAQMLPVPVLRPCVYAISQLIAHYGVTALLCTATQPALGSLFAEFLPGMAAQELCPREMLCSPVFCRTTFRKIGKQSWEQLAERLNAQKQVLCIVNSRKGAQEIFGLLQGEGCYHLSTLMYPVHREAVLAEIRRRLKADLPCTVVSTSLIEAGVDVDFPAVYREETGIDSILQAAGRCNREGKRRPEDSIVTVFQTETAPPPIFSIPIHAGRRVMEQYNAIGSQEAISAYFQELLDLKGKQAQDQQEILPLLQKELFPFRTVAERFRMIDSQTRTIYIPLGEGALLTEQLRRGERNRNLFRKLGKYSVTVYENQFRALDQACVLELLEDGSAILTDTELYDSQYGLAPDTDSAKALFI